MVAGDLDTVAYARVVCLASLVILEWEPVRDILGHPELVLHTNSSAHPESLQYRELVD